MTEIGEALQLGFAALQRGDARAASAHCRQAMSLGPRQPETHFLVGLVALELNDLKTAVSAFGSVTKLDPEHAAAWAQLARIFLRLGQPARAEAAAAEAKKAGVSDAAVEDLLGVVASLLGDQKSAKDWYARAVAHAPDRPAYGVNLATALMFLGENDEAARVVRQVLAGHGDIAQADWLLSSLHKAQDPARAETLLQKANSAGDAQSKAFFAYAAGKEFEDCGAWARAFDAFAAGAQAKRSIVDYDEAAEEAFFQALHETFDHAWASQSRTGHDDPSPIFVVGQPRTGTTLVERIITAHSDVESAGELQQFALSVRRLTGAVGERHSAQAVRAARDVDCEALGREYLRASKPMRSGAPRFVDKLPGNYLNIPLILAALPKARIVHLRRAPMDACFASYKQLFAEAYFHSYDQAEMARHFVRYARLMAHWREVFPGRFFDIDYEAVVGDVEPNARVLIEFLGLPWQEACLEFHRQDASVATASAVQVREKAHTRSIRRWRRYESQLAPMREIIEAAGLAGV
ncbi:MAG: sulfotransferase [Parvularculaceae bacterium]